MDAEGAALQQVLDSSVSGYASVRAVCVISCRALIP